MLQKAKKEFNLGKSKIEEARKRDVARVLLWQSATVLIGRGELAGKGELAA